MRSSSWGRWDLLAARSSARGPRASYIASRLGSRGNPSPGDWSGRWSSDQVFLTANKQISTR
jgi:hypothetical protein